jgi:hypothetical protein
VAAATSAAPPLPAPLTDPLYQDGRYANPGGSFTYAFAVPNGDYTLT